MASVINTHRIILTYLAVMIKLITTRTCESITACFFHGQTLGDMFRKPALTEFVRVVEDQFESIC